MPLRIPACPNISPRKPRVEYCFHLLPRAVATLLLSRMQSWRLPSRGRLQVFRRNDRIALEPLASCCSNGVPIGANLWTPHRSPLPCRAQRVEHPMFPLGRCRLACCSRKRRGIHRHKEASRRAILYVCGSVLAYMEPTCIQNWQLFVYVGAPLGRHRYRIGNCLSMWGRLNVHTELAIVCVCGSPFGARSSWCIRPPLPRERLDVDTELSMVCLRGSPFWAPI